MKNTILIENITKSFGKDMALNGLSLSVNPGITVVLGPNGAGKSTLLRCMAGLYKPDTGSIRVLGKDPYSENSVRGSIAFMPDNYGLYDFLSVRENLVFFGRLYGILDSDAIAGSKELLRILDAEKYIDTKVGALSRGTKQKILLCKAMLNDPEIILMDEPTAFLDANSSDVVRDYLIRESKDKKSIVFVTQKIDEATRFDSRICLVRNGRIAKDTTTEKLYSTMLKNTEVNIRFSKPLGQKTLGKIRGVTKFNSEKPTMISVKIRNYKEIDSLLSKLIENGAYIASVDYTEPLLEGLYLGDRRGD